MAAARRKCCAHTHGGSTQVGPRAGLETEGLRRRVAIYEFKHWFYSTQQQKMGKYKGANAKKFVVADPAPLRQHFACITSQGKIRIPNHANTCTAKGTIKMNKPREFLVPHRIVRILHCTCFVKTIWTHMDGNKRIRFAKHLVNFNQIVRFNHCKRKKNRCSSLTGKRTQQRKFSYQ